MKTLVVLVVCEQEFRSSASQTCSNCAVVLWVLKYMEVKQKKNKESVKQKWRSEKEMGNEEKEILW